MNTLISAPLPRSVYADDIDRAILNIFVIIYNKHINQYD
jgi:hypothetical protein